MSRRSLVVILMPFLVACTTKPQPIEYGTDGCQFCSMTIVDRQHASQIVTKKGKTFKFDSVECMLNYIKEVDNNKVSLFLVNDYSQPGKLVDATEAIYLISEGIPSPMGEFLTGFNTKENAIIAQKLHKGELLSWDELLNKFN